MLQKVLLTLYVVLVLSLEGCGHKSPKVDYCIIHAEMAVGLCHSSSGDIYNLTIEKMDNFICASPKDTERLLKACKKHKSAIISACLVDGKPEMFRCVSGDEKEFDLTLGQADGYVCNSPKDFERLLKWCGGYE